MCELCPANRDKRVRRLLYCNFDRDAEWPTMQYSLSQWRALYADTFLHWLFKLGGVSHFSLEGDELHLKFLGTSQYFNGSVLAILIYNVMPGDASANMSDLWAMICHFYKTHSVDCQFNNLSLQSFGDPDKRKNTISFS